MTGGGPASLSFGTTGASEAAAAAAGRVLLGLWVKSSSSPKCEPRGLSSSALVNGAEEFLPIRTHDRVGVAHSSSIHSLQRCECSSLCRTVNFASIDRALFAREIGPWIPMLRGILFVLLALL